MEFKTENYELIDYKCWNLGDKARKGINIKRLGLLKSEELNIFNESIPYQDQRNDPGHGEMTAYFTLKLLQYLPGEREIAVPAAILHDTGWSGGDPTTWKKLVDSGENTEGEIRRRPHQNRGCLVAGRILERVNYPKEYHNEIADIIGDHDTRKLPATDSGKIVRAADLLWRVTYPHAQIYMQDKNPEHIRKRIDETCLNKSLLPHLGEIGSLMALIEFENTMLFKFNKKLYI